MDMPCINFFKTNLVISSFLFVKLQFTDNIGYVFIINNMIDLVFYSVQSHFFPFSHSFSKCFKSFLTNSQLPENCTWQNLFKHFCRLYSL